MEEPTEERLIVLETTPTFGSSVRCVSLLCIHFTLEGSCELPEKRFCRVCHQSLNSSTVLETIL